MIDGLSAYCYLAWHRRYSLRAMRISSVFPLRYYPSVHLNSWRVYGDGFRFALTSIPFLFVHLTVPLVYGICIVVLLRRSRNEPNEVWEKILLLSLVGIAMFLA